MAKRRTLGLTREIQPIVIGCYTLTATDLTVKGRPSFEEHEGVGDFIKRAHRASGWWLAGWMRHAESREDWKERLSQAVDSTGLSEKTLKNVRAIGAIEPSRRRDDIDFSMHAEVAGLEPDEQSHWLAQAAENGWDRRELRLNIRASKRRRVLDGQAVLEGMFRVIYADNPWIYGDRPPSGSGAQQHYDGMSIEAQCKLPVAAHALPNSILFMWVTAPLLLANPGPREVGEAWGFEYKQQWIWDKVERNFGHYSNGNHEILTIWTRGSCLPDVPTDMPDSIQTYRKSNIHSAKPEAFRQLIQKHWTQGPYLELFARERADGWSCYGNDARLWSTQAAEQETVTI